MKNSERESIKTSRNTRLKKIILEIFREGKPLDVAELIKKVHAYSEKPNKTTLYRQIKTLLAENTIKEVLVGSEKTAYYEIATDHHHHFNCNDCGKILCITDNNLENNIHALEKKIEQAGHKINRHYFSLSGICEQCQEK